MGSTRQARSCCAGVPSARRSSRWRRSYRLALWGWRRAAAPAIVRSVFAAYGHDVRLMSPGDVRPYVKAQKNDDRDAEGIAGRSGDTPTMRFVELKSQEQLFRHAMAARGVGPIWSVNGPL